MEKEKQVGEQREVPTDEAHRYERKDQKTRDLIERILVSQSWFFKRVLGACLIGLCSMGWYVYDSTLIHAQKLTRIEQDLQQIKNIQEVLLSLQLSVNTLNKSVNVLETQITGAAQDIKNLWFYNRSQER